MTNSLDYKLIISFVSVALVIYGYFPYVRDVFLKKTKPHLYSWLVWLITFSTARRWQSGEVGENMEYLVCLQVRFWYF